LFSLKTPFANPSSLYIEARKAKDLLENARKEIGDFLNCQKENIVFTSGGTESNNLAILGIVKKAQEKGLSVPHIISARTEHSSVVETLEEAKRIGCEVSFVEVNSDGLVSIDAVKELIKKNTILISLMFVNNEIGTVFDIKEIGQMIKKYREENNSSYPLFHTDACQAPLFFPLDTSTLQVDLLSLDGLKVYGPRSSGVLYVRQKDLISPVLYGGGQEYGLRSGTEDVYSAIGLAKALILAKKERKDLVKNVTELRDYFLEKILEHFSKASLNGPLKNRVPNNINICFEGLDAEYLVVALDTYGVSASYSSSCRTLKEDSSSYVLDAIGKPECTLSSIRFTLGQDTTKDDIDFTLKALKKAIDQVER
jgi:cysteine desulfurase